MKKNERRTIKGRTGEAKLKQSKRRNLLFGLVAFVLLPLLALGGLELGLHWAGYGYSAAFFKPLRIRTSQFLVENDKFGWRFFPPEQARSPAPVVMAAEKPAGMYRIFILGESAALGDPRPAYGAGRYLESLLRERFPGRGFEVVCTGMTAVNSHAILPIARECARRKGDLWIIYMGNNEFVGPFGGMTAEGPRAPPPLRYMRLSLGIQRMRLGQLLMTAVRKLTGNATRTEAWGGMKMFLKSRIAADDSIRTAVDANFRGNLRDILRAGQNAGVGMILSTVAVNLRDCAPLGSLPEVNLATNEPSPFRELTAAAIKAEEAGNFAKALEAYEQAAKLEPQSAEIQFRWGNCLLRAANSPAAREHFVRACDFDALPFRADSRINSAIEEAGRQFAGPKLAWFDAVSLFSTNRPAGVPGRESFYEHVHFNFDGNYLLARAWAEQAERFLPASFLKMASANWASQEVCERRLGLTDWNRYGVLQEVLQRLSQAPFIDQLNHGSQLDSLKSQMQELRQRMDAPASAQARALYEEALKKAPSDHRLHENFAEYLEATGDLAEAVTHWWWVSELIPQHHLAYFQQGRLLARQGRSKEARSLLTQAVTLRPDLAEGWLELGNTYALEGEPELALKEYAREKELAPQDPRVYYHIGKALSKLNRRAEALDSFRQALRLRPGYWEARYALGEELAFGGKLTEARQEFEEVIRQAPDYAMAHLNLGVALVQQGRLDEALREFEETRRLDPNNKLAIDYAEQLRKRNRSNP